ncbi:glycosyl transferase family 90 [Wenyingzhuangia sp. IMCC45467]
MRLIKFKYYVKNVFLDIVPRSCFSKNIKHKGFNLSERVDYYNKLANTYHLKNSVDIQGFKRPKKLKTYYFDLIESLRYFPKNYKFDYEFGDVTEVPNQPCFVKSRPIVDDNQNSILLKLNKVRHFKFVKDKIRYVDKIDMMVGRAKIFAYHPHRIDFYKKYFKNPLCDLGAVNSPQVPAEWSTPKLSIQEHLKYKFILSLEGNDVATNLKWIMSSNSIAVSPKHKFETWFMEGTLIPDYHFICIKDDYSDLEEKLNYYIKHTDKALEIVKNANNYVKQFKDLKTEKAIAHKVVKKYFDLQEN